MCKRLSARWCEFGGGLWQVRLLSKVRFVVFGLERTSGRAAHRGGREVSPVPGVPVLVGGHTAVADIAVEYRRSLKVPSPFGSALHISAQAKFRPVACTPTERNDGTREDLRFRCKPLTDTRVRPCRWPTVHSRTPSLRFPFTSSPTTARAVAMRSLVRGGRSGAILARLPVGM